MFWPLLELSQETMTLLSSLDQNYEEWNIRWTSLNALFQLVLFLQNTQIIENVEDIFEAFDNKIEWEYDLLVTYPLILIIPTLPINFSWTVLTVSEARPCFCGREPSAQARIKFLLGPVILVVQNLMSVLGY